MNLYEIPRPDTCFIEELNVGDRFTLVQLSPKDTVWTNVSNHPVPRILIGQILWVEGFRIKRCRYRRNGGSGEICNGAIVRRV